MAVWRTALPSGAHTHGHRLFLLAMGGGGKDGDTVFWSSSEVADMG
jgi:hypothetical protein